MNYLGSALSNQRPVLSGRQREAADEASELRRCRICREATVSDNNGYRARGFGWVHEACDREDASDDE